MKDFPAPLAALESEAIQILRDGIAEARNPVVLFSGGKDSTVLAHLVLRAVDPAPPPLPLLHISSTREFAEVPAFRDAPATRHGFRLLVHANEEGRAQAINPFDHGDVYTTAMRTEPLRQALTAGGLPGYGQLDIETGLPCKDCGAPSIMVHRRVFGCVACAHRERRRRLDGRNHADPGHCPHGNP